jgi:replicative DNA helicase
VASKYVDTTAIIQVIGNIYNNPKLLDTTEQEYSISEEDFPEDFHKILIGVIYKLYQSGISSIKLSDINDFLESRPKSKAVFEANHGNDYLTNISAMANQLTFRYYYQRLKKFSLLRAYDDIGFKLEDYYDPDTLDTKKQEKQEEWLDNTTLERIADLFEARIDEIREKYTMDASYNHSYSAGDGIMELILKLEQHPDVGVPLYGAYINTITRGARLGKLYLRSAPTGVGKTRTMAADACYIGCNKLYDADYGWINNGQALPTVFIATEQDKEEIQTLMLAFLANVNERHILMGQYEGDERERVFKAAEIIKESPIWIEELPQFNLQDVENTVKRAIREHGARYIFHDYIHTSLKILEEISRRAGKIALREDNVLFMLSARLKEICEKHNVFMMTATQLNGDWKDSKTPDQNLLRGAKAIADKIDYGSVLLPVDDEDLAKLESILGANPKWTAPNLKLSVYKNRRGEYKSVLLWCKADLGTCRTDPMFMTDYQYNLIPIDDLKIMFAEEESAF